MSDSRNRIYLCLARMSGQEMQYIEDAFRTNWVGPLGPNVNAFEARLGNIVGGGVSNNKEINGLHEIVALSSGTAAIHLALLACGVGPGDEVLVQSFTFCASANPVVYLGGTPVFVDSEPDSWNMDPGVLEDAIRDRIARTGQVPKAIIPVSLYGMPYQADRILAVADRWGIPVVEDTAEGLGSRFDGRQVGTFGRYGVFSFNGNKMITTSVGGALVCGSPEEKAALMWRATQAREAYPYYQHEAIGYNYRMSNICAGIGLGQIAALDTYLAHHRHVNRLYRELFAGVGGIQVHGNPSARYDSNFWLTTITLDPSLRVKGQEQVAGTVPASVPVGSANVLRPGTMPHTAFEPADNVEALRRALDRAGIEARPLWKPLHLQPVFKDAPAYVNGVSESLFKVGLCLPSGPCVTEEDVHYIVDTVRSSLAGPLEEGRG